MTHGLSHVIGTLPSGTGISEKSTRHRTRRQRPQVGRQHRSQKPVATAVAVAAAEAKTLPANRANSGRRWRLSSPHTNARCAPPLCVAARGIGAIGQRARDKHHRAEAESGRFVANPHGAWERGSWITAHRNAGAPGGAVASTRSSQTWAWRVRPATTHGAGASGGEAAIVRPLWVRGTGRTRSPDAGRRPRPGEAGRRWRRAVKWRATRATKRGTPSVRRAATPNPASTTRTASACQAAPACRKTQRCLAVSRRSLGAARRMRRTKGKQIVTTSPFTATNHQAMAVMALHTSRLAP